MTLQLSRVAARRAWWAAQGFTSAASGADSAEAVSTARCWARALGGADPYFALAARTDPAKISVDAIAQALRAGELRVSPAVRGCMYLVPRAHADLALGIARALTQTRSARDLDKAGGSPKLLGKTARAVAKALDAGPMTTAELRKQPGVAEAIVSFGDAGKKVGLSSSLPPALRQLEFEGSIERAPVSARLDTETYAWSLRARALETRPLDELARALAELFFARHAPASLEHFTAWSGLTKGAAKRACAAMGEGLLPVEVEGLDGDEALAMWATPAALDAAQSKAKTKGEVLLGLQDLFLVAHGGPACVCPSAHLDVEIPRWGPTRDGAIRTTKHPHLRAVLVDGLLAGFWEVNAAMDAQHVAWLERPSKAACKRVEAKVAGLRAFMADELGHAKTYTIDSPAKIDARFALVQGLG